LQERYNYFDTSRNSIPINRGVLFDIIQPDEFDGFIILAGAISSYITYDRLVEFCKKYTVVPCISTSVSLPGVPAIVSDNETGILQLIDHLYKVHGYTKIANLRGPAHHKESDARFLAYKAGLERNGLPFDPGLVYEGDFWYFGGESGGADLLDRGERDFQAIVTGNDEMAVGALRELKRRGIKVPEDIAVCGFENIFEVRTLTPPLTTIVQPIFTHTPFIFASAITDRNIIVERMRRGAIAYFSKSLNEEDFLVTVEVHLKKYMEELFPS
jgi:phosphoserine phosphatase RsbU/P